MSEALTLLFSGLKEYAPLLAILVPGLLAFAGWREARQVHRLQRQSTEEIERLRSNLKVVEGWGMLLAKNEFDLYKEIWTSMPQIHSHAWFEAFMTELDDSHAQSLSDEKLEALQQALHRFASCISSNEPFIEPAIFTVLDDYLHLCRGIVVNRQMPASGVLDASRDRILRMVRARLSASGAWGAAGT